MKKLLICLFVMCSISAYSQKVEKKTGSKDCIELREQSVKYCELVCMGKFMSRKITVRLDYGQSPNFSGRIFNEEGLLVTFNSSIHAFNYMVSKGWKYIDKYVISIGNQNIIHYLFENTSKVLADGDVKGIVKK